MKVVSLFSGAGGFDLGFRQAGHEIIWANDLFIDAVNTYKCNLGHHIVCGDISNIPVSDIPDSDIIIGGFPCQGFSVANTKRTEKDERNVLYREFVRIIQAKQPKFFVAENVKGLLNLCKGKVFEMILADFEKAGYRVDKMVLNAADYGVPQKRERVIIVGIRNDIVFNYVYPKETHSQHTVKGRRPWVGVGKALEKIPDPDIPHNLKNHGYSKYKLRFNGYIGHRFIDPNAPAPTVTARGDDKGGVVVLHHPNNARRMSCRELATVQGFPINYEFCGTRSSIYRQIANAVPPPLGKAVAKQFNKYKERNA